jgi:pseudoazurin
MSAPITRRRALAYSAAAFAPVVVPKALFAAASHTVQMLNIHPENQRLRQVFFPRVLVVQPGDTVTFLATDRGHNSASIEGMIPEGAEAWNGRINEEIAVTLDRPGFYGYVCTPHASVGMVGLIAVEGDGMMDNLEAAQAVRQRGRAQQAWEEIWAEVAGMGLTG